MDIPTDCAICLEELSVDDTQLARPCDHRFHRWCLEMWLQQVYYVENSDSVLKYRIPRTIFVTKFTAASELQFKKPFTYYGQDLVSLELN